MTEPWLLEGHIFRIFDLPRERELELAKWLCDQTVDHPTHPTSKDDWAYSPADQKYVKCAQFIIWETKLAIGFKMMLADITERYLS